ncbi:MAG: alpha/beta hydrolase [Actinobacteria bacterium]|nr:alpha/beta hydrolase [Actinomycetota bacterium]
MIPAIEDRATLDVGGIRTTYLEGGVAGAPSVLLVHDGGYGSDAVSTWETVIDDLGARFHWVAPDLIGHGGTAKLVSYDKDPLTFRLDHLVEFIRTKGMGKPAVVGASFGGALALNIAARKATEVSSVVSISGTGGLYMVEEEFAQIQDYEPSLDGALRIQSRMEPDPPQLRVEQRLERSLLAGHWEALSASRLRNPATTAPMPDWRPRYLEALSEVRVPVLLIAGSDDPLLETGWAKDLVGIIPGCTHAVIDGARHLPQLSHPEETLLTLVRFLEGA